MHCNEKSQVTVPSQESAVHIPPDAFKNILDFLSHIDGLKQSPFLTPLFLISAHTSFNDFKMESLSINLSIQEAITPYPLWKMSLYTCGSNDAG